MKTQPMDRMDHFIGLERNLNTRYVLRCDAYACCHKLGSEEPDRAAFLVYAYDQGWRTDKSQKLALCPKCVKLK